MLQAVLTNFHKFDADKDGFLSETVGVAPLIMREITKAQQVLVTGAPVDKLHQLVRRTTRMLRCPRRNANFARKK